MINVSTPRHQRFTPNLQRDLFDGVYSGAEAREFASALVDATVQTFKHRNLRAEIHTESPDPEAASSIADLSELSEELMDKIQAAHAQGRRVQLRCTISLEIDQEGRAHPRRA